MDSIEGTIFEQEFPPQISMESYRWEYPFQKNYGKIVIIPNKIKQSSYQKIRNALHGL